MRARIVCLSVVLILVAGTGFAQEAQKAPNVTDVYCSGQVTTERIPTDSYLISGEQSNTKVIFSQGNLVYINKGASDGVKVGDEFEILRPVSEQLKQRWFRWQDKLMRAMGTLYHDTGRIRVVNVHPKVSTAEVVYTCDYMQRGDIARPFAERPAPQFKEAAQFDRFAPVNGKPLAMVVAMKHFAQIAGTNSIVYINLGAAQGVKVGDYFRVFRYQGSRDESAYQTPGYAHELYGFGSTPQRYSWNDLPREILGEGIVLRTSEKSSTVLLTLSVREIYAGDYVELE